MFGAFTFQTYLVFWPLNFHLKFQMLFLYWCYLNEKHEMETAFLPVKKKLKVTLFASVDKVLKRGKDTLQMLSQMQKKKKN